MRLDEQTRGDFPILSRIVNGHPLVYLDSAASSQKPRSVVEAMARYYERSHANVHRSIHTLGEEATELYEAARDRVQRFVNAAAREEIVFTRGTTDGIGIVAEAVGRTLRPGDEILVTELEHHSNLVPWQVAVRDHGATVRAVPLVGEGVLDLDALDRLLSPRTRLVAVAHVSNVLGTIVPVAEIVARARRVGALTLVDGAQAVPHMPVDMSLIGCDFYVFSGHKMYAPTGSGVVYGKIELLEKMNPFQGGGDMIRTVTFEKTTYADAPNKFEAGTPAIASQIGLGAAIDYLDSIGREHAAAYEAELLRYATERVSAIEGVRIIGTAKNKASVLSFVIDDIHPHDIGTILDQEGIAVRAGHHCAQPVMRRFNVPATARASFSFYNTKEEIDVLARTIERVIEIFS